MVTCDAGRNSLHVAMTVVLIGVSFLFGFGTAVISLVALFQVYFPHAE
jgi:hypothetical protein